MFGLQFQHASQQRRRTIGPGDGDKAPLEPRLLALGVDEQARRLRRLEARAVVYGQLVRTTADPGGMFQVELARRIETGMAGYAVVIEKGLNIVSLIDGCVIGEHVSR
jgi:hypothetical protein